MATQNRGGRFFHNLGMTIQNAPNPSTLPTAIPNSGGMIRVPHRSRYANTGNGTISHSSVGNNFNKLSNGDSMNPLAQNYLIGGKTFNNQIY